MSSAVAVKSRSGQVHVAKTRSGGYGLLIVMDTICGRYLKGGETVDDLESVTTRQVCKVCVRHLDEVDA